MDLTDSYRHKGLRKRLVEKIKAKAINNEGVLKAIEKVPRHYFFDSSFLEFAYDDKAFPIGFGQTISQPYTVAFQSQLLEVKAGDKILEVGTGSGYQACILIELGAKVYSIERLKDLYKRTKTFLSTIGYFPKLFYGDGYKGLAGFAPFDKIIVTAGAPEVPEDLLKQLKIGGFLVIPVGKGTQTMCRIKKLSKNEFEKTEFGSFSFVPMLNDSL